jgi:hypothetical protein
VQVSFRLKAVVKEFLGTGGVFTGVLLGDGTRVEADVCIIGAGAHDPLWTAFV